MLLLFNGTQVFLLKIQNKLVLYWLKLQEITVVIGVDLKDFSALQLKITLEQLVSLILIIPDKIQTTMDVTKIGVTKFVFVDLFQLKIQLKILYQKNALKMIVMIIEDNKIIQFLVQLARTGKLNPHKVMIEPKKITQILVLETIITAETLMEQVDLGVILLTQIIDGSYVIH